MTLPSLARRASPEAAANMPALLSVTTVRWSPWAARVILPQLVEREDLRSGDRAVALQRRALAHLRDGLGDVGRGYRLDERGGQAHGVVVGVLGQRRIDELEELGGPDDRVRHGTGLEDVLLQHLGAVVDQARHTVGAHDREDDCVADPGSARGRDQVIHALLEERGRGVVEGRRVGQVDHDVGPAQRLGQALPGEQVQAGVRATAAPLRARPR